MSERSNDAFTISVHEEVARREEEKHASLSIQGVG